MADFEFCRNRHISAEFNWQMNLFDTIRDNLSETNLGSMALVAPSPHQHRRVYSFHLDGKAKYRPLFGGRNYV